MMMPLNVFIYTELVDLSMVLRRTLDDSNISEMIYSHAEMPFGKTWEEWTGDWWKWLISIPKDKNPAIDATGEKFDSNQSHHNVVFLAGTFGGFAERSHVISSGNSILFPIINFTTSYHEQPLIKSESELRYCAKKDMDDIVYKKASIDGFELQQNEICRVQSSVFDLTYPENNVSGLPVGTTSAISDGYWVFLKRLLPGMHDIYAAGSCSSGKTAVKIIWHLKVED